VQDVWAGPRLLESLGPFSSREKVPTDKDTTQRQEGLVNVGPFFVAHAQAPELIQPSKGPFDHPAPSPQSATMFCIAFRKKRDDASVTQTLPDRFGIVTAVTEHAVRTPARASALSLQDRDRINQ